MRMAFWFVITVSVLVGGFYLAHTMGWIDIHHWVRVLEDFIPIRSWRITI